MTAMGPPTADLDPAGAVCELRGASVYDALQAVVRPYVTIWFHFPRGCFVGGAGFSVREERVVRCTWGFFLVVFYFRLFEC